MKTSRMNLGQLGEDVACEFLTKNGHKILERNWRKGHLESDIITVDCNGLHFVEVKSRTAPVSADPLANITSEKRRRMTRSALSYLNRLKNSDYEIFIDVLTVVFDGERRKVDYYPQAVLPIYY